MRPADINTAEQLRAGLAAFEAAGAALPGIADPAASESLVSQMIDSIHRVDFVRRLDERPIDPARLDPTSALFDPIRGARLLGVAGDLDEAAWLIFLATHFGYHRRWHWELTRRVYSGLGLVPNWTWARTSSHLDEFDAWFEENAGGLADVPFGNHRKFESLRPDAKKNLSKTVRSYVVWVGQNQGFAVMIAAATAIVGDDPKALFDHLYRTCPIVQFGRTAQFDLLTMWGKLRIADIEPPHPYLQGASGPLAGARLLFAGTTNAPVPWRQLSTALVALGSALGVGMQVMEDSLCNWQKSQFQYRPFRG
jgi:hypothetical protein